MQVDDRPTEQYSDIDGLDRQIQQLVEAVVLPITHKDTFTKLELDPPKGALLYGPPGTGKTLLARTCAAQAKSTYLKLAGFQLVQTFIGDGAKLVRDGQRQGGAPHHAQAALSDIYWLSSSGVIRVIMATNRADILDPALLRSGRLDRKIEFPHPTEAARARIMQIHSRKMNFGKDVNFEELSRCTDDFNGAQCKAVCVEAGMIALRRDGDKITHEDYMDAILEVQARKKASLNYYA